MRFSVSNNNVRILFKKNQKNYFYHLAKRKQKVEIKTQARIVMIVVEGDNYDNNYDDN